MADMPYQPLYAEKRCLVCGRWRGEHIGDSTNDTEMLCPIPEVLNEYTGKTATFLPGMENLR